MTPTHKRINRQGVRYAIEHFGSIEGAIKYHQRTIDINDFSNNTGALNSLKHSIKLLKRLKRRYVRRNFKAIPYRLGIPKMNNAITFRAKDFTDARHWVIDHLNLSENYTIIEIN